MGQGERNGSADDSKFARTLWTVVRRAKGCDSPEAQEAFAQLYRDYWYPLYAFVRHRGYPHHDAQDLTQGFFYRLITKNALQSADPAFGLFRSFLIASLKNFLNNEYNRSMAEIRGGKQFFVSWEELHAEEQYAQYPVDGLTPDILYDRRWAHVLMEKAMTALRRECVDDGEQSAFEVLQIFLSGAKPASYKEVAARLNLTEAATRTRVSRLKKKYRRLLRTAVAETLEEGQDVDAELRHLLEVWN
jgi:RNA polymerase sigma factor (sigma-70 family)